jgi:hypothetical protein
MNQQLRHPAAPPLPPTNADLAPLRHLKAKRSLNDLVEDQIVALWEDEDFQSYTYAVYDEQAVEGSLALDNGKAAEMIRALAKEKGVKELADQKLSPIVKAMNIVLRRYALSRKERRNTVHGEVVPNEHNGGE